MNAIKRLAFVLLVVGSFVASSNRVQAHWSCYNVNGYECWDFDLPESCELLETGYETYNECLASLEQNCWATNGGTCYGGGLSDIGFTPYTDCSATCWAG